jgi:hypothetical protein
MACWSARRPGHAGRVSPAPFALSSAGPAPAFRLPELDRRVAELRQSANVQLRLRRERNLAAMVAIPATWFTAERVKRWSMA